MQADKKEQMLFQNQFAEPVTCVPGAKPAMSSPAQPAVPAPLANLKIQHTKVSHLWTGLYLGAWLKPRSIEASVRALCKQEDKKPCIISGLIPGEF